MKRRTKKGKKTKKPIRRESVLAKLMILLLLCALAWRLHGLRSQVAKAEAERDRQSLEVAELEEKNREMEADLAAGTTPEKVEELAREELGLIRKDEYVFYAGG